MKLTEAQRLAKKREYYYANRDKWREYAQKRKAEKSTFTPKNDIKFNGNEKEMVRNTVLKYAKETGDLLDMYGASGEMFNKVRKEAKRVNITSIDDGRSFKNKGKLKSTFNHTKGTMFTSLSNYINKATDENRKGTIWLDYCGPLSNETRNDLRKLYGITKSKGYLFITLLKARETYLPAGTDREMYDAMSQAFIKKDLKSAGIKITPIFQYEYKSIPEYQTRKKGGPSPIGVYGYKYTKDENFVKRLLAREAKAVKSMFSKKQIKNMIQALEKLGYQISNQNG